MNFEIKIFDPLTDDCSIEDQNGIINLVAFGNKYQLSFGVEPFELEKDTLDGQIEKICADLVFINKKEFLAVRTEALRGMIPNGELRDGGYLLFKKT